MRARQRSFLVRAGAIAVLLSVLLPNIAYAGHWSSGGHAHAVQSEAEASAHAAHCHLGPSKCSGEPDLTGVSWIGQASVSVATADTERLVPPRDDPSRTDPPAARLLEPPRAA